MFTVLYESCVGRDRSEEDPTPEDFPIKIPQRFVTGPGEARRPSAIARASDEASSGETDRAGSCTGLCQLSWRLPPCGPA
jgi:hypothetical protein